MSCSSVRSCRSCPGRLALTRGMFAPARDFPCSSPTFNATPPLGVPEPPDLEVALPEARMRLQTLERHLGPHGLAGGVQPHPARVPRVPHGHEAAVPDDEAE